MAEEKYLPPKPEDGPPLEPVSPLALLFISLVLESALLLAASLWCHSVKFELLPFFSVDWHGIFLGVLTGTATAISCLGLIMLKDQLPWMRPLRDCCVNELAVIIAKTNFFELVLLSLASGFAEETLFRGVMQSQWGLLASNIVFSLLHDPTYRKRSYLLSVFFSGLIFGLLFMLTNNLWAPISAHIVHNLISFCCLRYFVHKL